MNAVAFDTHAAVRKLRDADISERQAEVLVEVFSHAIGEPATRDDIKDLVTKAELAALEARLTWRFAGAMLAQTLAILGGVLGSLRLLAD